MEGSKHCFISEGKVKGKNKSSTKSFKKEKKKKKKKLSQCKVLTIYAFIGTLVKSWLSWTQKKNGFQFIFQIGVRESIFPLISREKWTN